MTSVPNPALSGDPAHGNSGPGGPLPTEIGHRVADIQQASVESAGEIRNGVTDLPHPRWCDRNGCGARGVHRGRVTEISTTSGDYAAVSVSLAQPYLRGEPFIIITGEAGSVFLSIRQAKALGHSMRNSVRRAETGR